MRKKILYLGSRGFPFEPSAQIQRQIMISKILIEAGYDVTVICTKGIFRNNKIRFKGKYEKINYIYTSFTSKYYNFRLLRLVFTIFGRINEFFYILIQKILSNQTEIIFFVNTKSIYLLKYYRIISKIINAKLTYNYVEYVKSLSPSNSYFKNNLELFDQSVVKLSDNLICISDFLIAKIQEKSSKKSIIKIPAITDFDKFDNIKINPKSGNEYFLYCGALAYTDIIIFIINSFELVINNKINLIIVTNGSDVNLKDLKDLIYRNTKKEQISVLSNLEFEDLISLYKNALALLIPLRSTIQDIARFPHKLSEYTASGTPIITTNNGEIKNYFTDYENAFVASTYDPTEFAKKMEFVITNKELAEQVGKNGRKIGEKFFDYKNYITKISKFIED